MGLMWGLPNHWDFAQDSVVPLGQLARMDAAGDRVTQYRYPPLHLKLLSVLFLPVRLIVNTTAIGENEKLSATFFILAARLVSVAMALGTLRLLVRIGKRVWNERAGLLAAILFLLSPVTLYYAKTANLDIPYIFWLTWALLIYVRILQENRTRDYLWLGLLAALAVCTKDQAYAFFILMPLPIIHRLWKKPADESSSEAPTERWRKLGLGLVGFAVPFVVIHNILLDPQAFRLHVMTIIGPASEGWREFARGPSGQIRLLLETVLCLMDAWTPAGLLLVGIGLWIGLRAGKGKSVKRALLVPLLSYYLFFPCVTGYVYARFVLPVILVLALFGGAGILRLWEWRRRDKAFGKAAVIALVGWVGLAGLSLNILMGNYSRYDAQKWLEKHCSAQTRICYLGEMRDMPRFNEPLDPKPLMPPGESLAPERALRAKRPDLLVLSFEQGHWATDSRPMRPSSIIRRQLRKAAFGRSPPSRADRDSTSDFHQALLRGDLGYVIKERFASPIAPFVPEVAESVNRTIIIMEPKN